MKKTLMNKRRLRSKAHTKSESVTQTQSKNQVENKVQAKSKNFIASHDKFFKLFYSDPEFTKRLLQLVFSKKELKTYDLNKLKVEKDSFENKRADLIVSIPFKEAPKMKIRLLVLLEHKSYHDQNLFEQILNYQILMRKHSIQQTGYPYPIIPVVFYHGKEPMKWAKSFQEESFKDIFSKIPMESRKDMLNYNLRIINTKDPKVRKAYKGKKLKGYGIINLLSEIWSIKKRIPPFLKLKDLVFEFEDILRPAKGKEEEEIVLRLFEYLRDNTKLDLNVWKKLKKLLIEEGILTKEGGEDMESIRELIEAKGIHKGRQEGRQEGLQEGRQTERQAVILNMLKEKLDFSVISKVTGLSEEEIKKLKNGK